MLVENAIKHNSSSLKNPLFIEIFTDNANEFVIVKNNLRFKKTVVSTKTGLKSIIERYKLLNNTDVEIEKTDKYFIVKLPLVKSL
jgi:LytS/YehU family sensor histidine kinase